MVFNKKISNIIMLEKDVSVGQDNKSNFWYVKNLNSTIKNLEDDMRVVTDIVNRINLEILNSVGGDVLNQVKEKKDKSNKIKEVKDLVK